MKTQVLPSPNGTPANSGDMTQTLTSEVLLIPLTSMVNFECVWVGTNPAGWLSVQASNDFTTDSQGNPLPGATWTSLDLQVGPYIVSQIHVLGNSGSIMVDIALVAAYAIQVLYVPSSGSGQMVITANTKDA